MNALVVEGEESDRRLLTEAAAAAGLEVAAAADLPSARHALAERGDAGFIVCGVALAAEVARAAPSALLVATAAPDQLAQALAALGTIAFDVLPKPLEVDACIAALTRAREHLRQAGEAERLAGELGHARAQAEMDLDETRRNAREMPRLDRLRAELSEAVACELDERLACVPALLDDGAGHITEAGPRSAIVDASFAARQAIRMVADLVDVQRSARGVLSASPRKLPLRPFLVEVLAAVGRVAADYEASIDFSLAGEAVECEADPDMLSRLLVNLLETALRRSRRVRVRFDVASDGESVRFTVEDQGGGVPERLLANLFDRRSRLEPGSIQRGAALGFCQAAAAALGAELRAETNGESGLRVILRLPCRATARRHAASR